MRYFREKDALPIALACGVLLMLGWFTLTIAQLEQNSTQAESDLTQASVPVLMYHHLLPQDALTGMFADNNVAVSVEQFTQDIATLKAQGYHTISLRQLDDFVQGKEELPGKCVVITFDDGYLSNKIYAMPVLREAGYTAVIFALTGWIEEHPQEFRAAGLQYLKIGRASCRERVFGLV